ncbi:peptidase M14 family protein [bacterium (candidate division B38) B3_B38]|nr:MAG: peptidase M14 family protein [bacterium (candidate division B38) B3_B38]
MRDHKITFALLIALMVSLFSAGIVSAQKIPSPEEFFGFKMGTDYKLARWDKIVEYFYLLDKNSPKIAVQELGKSTEGNRFLLAIISSAENLKNLDKYKSICRKLADPRGLSAREVDKLVQEGKTVVAMTMSLHATEVGGNQLSPELAYELITSPSPEIKTILDNVIFLLFPSFNPDGQIMVVDWYNKYLGTEYENSRLPWMYHKYTGHDNNRDAYMLTQAESRHVSRVLYNEWFPQFYVDMHHMGSSGARYYIPPYYDPLHPNVDPLIWREHMLVGSHMAVKLEEAGKKGIETGAPYTAWWMASFHMITNYHNIAGMLTESASAQIASPIYIHPDQLRPGRRGRPEYKAQLSFPSPWEGGWWRLRDIVEQQKISTMALLDVAARFRDMFLRNAYHKAMRNVNRGKSEPPYAYIIPANQRDPLTAVKLVQTLMLAGVEVHQTKGSLQVNNSVYPPGSYVILLAQPLRAYVKSLLEQINYPDNPWTREYPGGPPMRPYDMAAFNIAEHMGVKAIPIDTPVTAPLTKIKEAEMPEGRVIGSGKNGYLLEHETNDSFIAINRLLKEGAEVYWLKKSLLDGERSYPPGTIFIPDSPGLKAKLEAIARQTHLTFYTANQKVKGEAYKLRPLKLGMYKRYMGGSMDEGWTRWILEQFQFPFASIYNKEMKEGKLREKYDVIIFPDDRMQTIIGPADDEEQRIYNPTPPEYRGGIGDEGVKNLEEFVQQGGTLITLDSACELPIKKFLLLLPIENVLEGVSSEEFFCPGSTLHIKLNHNHPVSYGMGEDALALFWNSPAFSIDYTPWNERYQVVARYPEENQLQSGWLIGGKRLSRKAAIIDAQCGEGRVILLGFRVQHRAQTHGTFKLLFNSIYYGSAIPEQLP